MLLVAQVVVDLVSPLGSLRIYYLNWLEGGCKLDRVWFNRCKWLAVIATEKERLSQLKIDANNVTEKRW